MQAAPGSTLSALADPPSRMVDGAVMDYFLIEAVSALRVSSAVATARAKKIERDMAEAGLLPPPPAKQQNSRDSTSSTAGKMFGLVDEEESVRSRLEAIGVHVGSNFAERCVELFTGIAQHLNRLQGFAAIAHCLVILWMLSSLFVRIFGSLAGTSKSTTCAQITE